MKHKHADLIHAWADGAEIQLFVGGKWIDVPNGLLTFSEDYKYRIKPGPKPDIVMYGCIDIEGMHFMESENDSSLFNIKLTFDGDDWTLKSAEVLK